MQTLSILGLSHTVFGIILLLAKKKDRPDYILIFWLAVLMMPFLQNLLPGLPFLNPAFTLLSGPCLYIYMREVTKRDESRLRYAPHLIPFLFFYILLLFSPAPLMPGGPRAASGLQADGFILLRSFGSINFGLFLFYAAYSLRALRIHRRTVRETYAYENSGISLIWLTLLPLLFLFLILLTVLAEQLSAGKHLEIAALHQGNFLLFTLYLIFFGLRQKPVYPVRDSSGPKDPGEEISSGSGKQSNDEDSRLLAKMDALMSEEKLYLNPVLSAYDLAQATGLSRHRISALLNSSLSRNFYQYVNGYRLEEVKAKLEEDTENNHNILELAFDSGFNSKSTFNSLFRNKYSMTPSQYKKSVRIREKTSE